MKNKAGFTLIELLVVIIILGIGARVLAKSLLDKALKGSNRDSFKSLLIQASRKSLTEARHYGVHYDSTTKIIGVFRDLNADETFNSADTLMTATKLNARSIVKILNSDGGVVKDICFKKNGSTSTGKSYSITYKGVGKDTFALQVIAASGQILEL